LDCTPSADTRSAKRGQHLSCDMSRISNISVAQLVDRRQARALARVHLDRVDPRTDASAPDASSRYTVDELTRLGGPYV
jgi:hypothetical protein